MSDVNAEIVTTNISLGDTGRKVLLVEEPTTTLLLLLLRFSIAVSINAVIHADNRTLCFIIVISPPILL